MIRREGAGAPAFAAGLPRELRRREGCISFASRDPTLPNRPPRPFPICTVLAMSSLAPNSQPSTKHMCALASSTAARSGSVLRRHLLLCSTECRPRLPSSSATQRPFSSSLLLIAAALQPCVPCIGSCTGPLLPPCGLSVRLVLLFELALARMLVFLCCHESTPRHPPTGFAVSSLL